MGLRGSAQSHFLVIVSSDRPALRETLYPSLGLRISSKLVFGAVCGSYVSRLVASAPDTHSGLSCQPATLPIGRDCIALATSLNSAAFKRSPGM